MSEDIRLNLDEDDTLLNTPLLLSTNEANPLQGQGQEIVLTDDILSEVQHMMDNPTISQANIFQEEDSKARDKSANRVKITENLVDLQSNKNLIEFNRNKSLPRKINQPKPGLNFRNNKPQFNQHQYAIPLNNQHPFGHFDYKNSRTPMGDQHNMAQNFKGNFGGHFQNLPPQRTKIIGHKTWNSANRNMIPAKKQGFEPNSINNFPLNQQKPEIQPSKINNADQINNYTSEDWFSKIDQNCTIKGTIGTKEILDPSTNNEENFIMELTQKESHKSDINSNLSDLINMDNQPSAPPPLIHMNSSGGNKEELNKDSEDIKKELRYIVKEKELNAEVSREK